jgi:hypothetical protein
MDRTMFTTANPAFVTSARIYLHSLLVAWVLFACVLPPALGQPAATLQPPTEQQKIDYLIATVATLHEAVFIRNGTAYDASRAAAHMRLKLRFAGSRVKTANDFIIYCATSSSASGINYTIRFSNGLEVDAATYLRGKLATYTRDNPSHPH